MMKEIIRLMFFGLIFFPVLLFSADKVGMVTGSSTGTYIKFGKEIAKVSKKEGVIIQVKESKGSVDNIKRLASTENVAFAIVQSDVLGYLAKSTNPKFKSLARKLRLVFPFYNEEIHLFADKKINSIHDLTGKKVVVGMEGSGTNMTVWNLLNLVGVNVGERIHKSSKDGVRMVLKGDADAVFYVAGKPVTLFENLYKSDNDNVKRVLANKHFVALDDKDMLNEYVRSELTSSDYNITGDSVPTIAVKAMLVSFNFSSGKTPYFKKRCQQLGKIGKAIRNNIEILKESGHKKWKEVNLDGKVGSWKLDQCSRSDTGDNKPSYSNSGGATNMDKEIECVLSGKC